MRQTTVAWYVTTPWGRLETLHQEGAVVTVSGGSSIQKQEGKLVSGTSPFGQ